MRLPMLVLMVLASFSSSCFSQCENGQCFKTPLRRAAKAIVQVQPVRSAVRGVYQSVSSVRSANAVQSYGSTGSAVQSYGSTGSAVSYGSTGSMVYNQCNCYDSDGAVITSFGVPYASSVSGEVSSLGIRHRKASRDVIVEAATKARAEGSIGDSELRAIKLASRSPRMLAMMEDLILEKAQASGAYSFALDANGDVIKAGINWEAIGDFILKIAPIIFKLIEMFALDTSGDGTATMFANVLAPPLNFVSTLGQFSGC